MTDCNVRFMDNQKIDGNYTVTNEDSGYPLTNAIGKVRSRVFRTTGTSTRITIDLLFPDKINAMTLFAPLGKKLGISKEATIRLQADNVNSWASPELDLDVSLSRDDRLVYFIGSDVDSYYRFWSLNIDDPTNPQGYLEIADIYLGDYTTTPLRNVDNGFSWVTKDPSIVRKSIDGTAYFETKTKYDTFGGLRYGLCTNETLETLQDLYDRQGISSFMPISLDPQGVISGGDIEELTRLARFSGDFSRSHRVYEYYDVGISLEEVI